MSHSVHPHDGQACANKGRCVLQKSLGPQPEILRDPTDPHIEQYVQTNTILLYLSKASGNVPSKHLLLKLDFDGVRGKTQDWIRYFLRDSALQIKKNDKTERARGLGKKPKQKRKQERR